MGISTGQTSLQAPQSEEALGRSASSLKRSPKSSGERTDLLNRRQQSDCDGGEVLLPDPDRHQDIAYLVNGGK